MLMQKITLHFKVQNQSYLHLYKEIIKIGMMKHVNEMYKSMKKNTTNHEKFT